MNIEKFKNKVGSFVHSLTEAVVRISVHKPLYSICFSLLLILLVAIGASKIEPDFTYRIWFREHDPLLKAFDEFERKFGNDDNFSLVIYSPNGIFDEKSIQSIQALTKELWQAPEVIRVDSLVNYNYVTGTSDELQVQPFIADDVLLSPEYLLEKKNTALAHSVLPKYLINNEATVTIIYATLKPALEKIPDYKHVKDYLKTLIEKHKLVDDQQYYISGSAAINVTFEEVSKHDMESMLPILLGCIILLLAWYFKGPAGVVFAFSVALGTIAVTFGAAGWFGIKFNVIISVLPSVMIAICIAVVVHIVVNFYQFYSGGLDRIAALEASVRKNFVPTFLTSFTTAQGFWALVPTELRPVSDMGFLASIGTLASWFITMFLVVPLLRYWPFTKREYSSFEQDESVDVSKMQASDKMIRYVNFIDSHKWKVIFVFIFITIASLYLGTRNTVNSDPFEYFSKNVDLKIANDFIENNMTGTTGLELVLDSGVEDGIKEPEFLNKVEKLEAYLIKEKVYVNKIISVLDILRNMNRSLNADQAEFFSIPATKAGVAENLFLYNMNLPQGMDLNNRMSLDNRYLRMTIMIDIHDSKSVLAEIDNIEKSLSTFGLQGLITGKVPLYQKMNGYVVDTFFSSIASSFLQIGAIMFLLFMSIKFGIISMIPNVFPLVLGGAIMYLLGKPIDMGTVMIASVCFGITVDDTIHFLVNYKKLRSKKWKCKDALATTLTYTGSAISITTFILVLGFGTFAFADFIPNVNFGIMTAVVLSAGLVTEHILLPAILILTEKD